MNKRSETVFVLLLIAIAILCFIGLLAAGGLPDGSLSGQNQKGIASSSPTDHSTPQPSQENQGLPLNYFTIGTKRPKYDISMHVLEIDSSNPELLVKPVISHQTLFGFAFMSDMDKKGNALATVNGGFSHPDGHPGGLYGTEGKLVTTATGIYPALFMADGKVFIEDVTTPVWLEGQYEDTEEAGQKAGEKHSNANGTRLENIYYNQYPKGDGLYVFTPDYGSQNRIRSSNLTAVISDGEVRGLVLRSGSFEIPKDGFLVSAIGEYSEARLQEAVKPGMHLEIKYEIITDSGKIIDYEWAYECGSWILKEGKTVVLDSDTWVGTLRIRTPRTAVGIKEDGTLVFIVADGRQKGLSDGLTGEELAQELLGLGIKDAAFLDGGASSEMIIGGQIVNSPSAGRERMLASCFLIVNR